MSVNNTIKLVAQSILFDPTKTTNREELKKELINLVKDDPKKFQTKVTKLLGDNHGQKFGWESTKFTIFGHKLKLSDGSRLRKSLKKFKKELDHVGEISVADTGYNMKQLEAMIYYLLLVSEHKIAVWEDKEFEQLEIKLQKHADELTKKAKGLVEDADYEFGEDLIEMEKQIENFKNEADFITRYLSFIKELSSAIKSKNSEVFQNKSLIEEDVKKLNKQLNELKKTAKELKEKAKIIDDNKDVINNQCERLEKQVEDLEDKIKFLEKNISNLKEFSKNIGELQIQQDFYDNFEEIIEQQQLSIESEIKDKQRRIKEIEVNISEADKSSEVEESSEAEDITKTTVKDQKDTIESLNNQKTSIYAEIKNLKNGKGTFLNDQLNKRHTARTIACESKAYIHSLGTNIKNLDIFKNISDSNKTTENLETIEKELATETEIEEKTKEKKSPTSEALDQLKIIISKVKADVTTIYKEFINKLTKRTQPKEEIVVPTVVVAP